MFEVEVNDRLKSQGRHPDSGQVNQDSIPGRLEEMVPGPFLAAVLSSLDRSRLTGHDLVLVLRAEARMASHYQALSYESMAEVSHRTDGEHGRCNEAAEFASDEIRAALKLTRRSADMELGLAVALFHEHPGVWKSLMSGDIDLRRARAIIDSVGHLPEETAALVVDEVIDKARHLTTGELRAWIRRLSIEIDPEGAKTRYEKRVGERRVFFEINDEGTVDLMGLDLPLARATAARNRINSIARSLNTKTESRTLDQIRADVFLDLLCGLSAHDKHAGGSVNIHVELATLAGLDDKAAEIPGVGPVIADIARQVISTQTGSAWNYLVTDQGRPVATGTTRRRPTKTIKRRVLAAYPTCVFPGCRMPATECDLDHRQRWEHGGPTEVSNLAPGCRHDHTLLDHNWALARQPNGDHTWTSPLGHTYTKPIRPP